MLPEECDEKISAALTKQREEFEDNSAAKHWHDLYRKECLLRQDDAARFGQAREDAESTLGALQLRFDLRWEIIERLTQERDRAVVGTVERCAGIAEQYERDPVEGELAIDDRCCSRAIRSLAPKVEKERTPVHEMRHMPMDLLKDIIEEFDESAEVTRNSNVDGDGNWSEEEIDQPAKARFEWLVQTANQLRAMLKAEGAEGVPSCLDCGKPYRDFPLDSTLPDDQWRMIHDSDGGLLCANCMVARAATLPGAIAVRMRIELAAAGAKG